LGTSESYDVVIDLSSTSDLNVNLNSNGLFVAACEKTSSADYNTFFCEMLWRAGTVIFPSPRNPKFYECMRDAARWIQNGDIVVDSFWTESYNRHNEWQNAFNDGVNRPANYSRGFIHWNSNGN